MTANRNSPLILDVDIIGHQVNVEMKPLLETNESSIVSLRGYSR